MVFSIFLFFLAFSFTLAKPLVSNPPYGGKCGNPVIRPNTEDKIVGGTVATPYSWPWQVVWCIEWNGKCALSCGGTVVGTHWVMTAGHCVAGSINDTSDFRVKTGVFDETLSNETGEIIHKVKTIHLHPKYTSDPDPQWDVAIIELEDVITYGPHVQPICIPKTNTDRDSTNEPNTAWGTGWGTVSETGRLSHQLRQVNVPFVNYTLCNKEYGDNYIQPEIMICAGVQGKDTCQGDSGGPLQQKNINGYWFQYGITSFGYGCAEKGYPGVYSRTSAYCDFIANVTKKAVECQDPNTY